MTAIHDSTLSSSRPDLIDSALLRPGRLDKSILCNMPTKEERKEVRSKPPARPPCLPFLTLSFPLCCRFYKPMQEKSLYRTASTLITSLMLLRGSRAPTSKRYYITHTLRLCMRALAAPAISQSRLQPSAVAVAAARTTVSTIRLSSTRHLEGPLRTTIPSSRAQSR